MENYKSIFEFLIEQPKVVFDSLYGDYHDRWASSHWACQAIFQSLSMLSKSLVMRQIFTDASFKRSDLKDWMNPDHHNEVDSLIDELLKLRIFESQPKVMVFNGSETKVDTFILNHLFRESLKNSLLNPQKPWQDNDENPTENASVLNQFSDEQWNIVLAFLVNLKTPLTSNSQSSSSEIIKQFLIRSGSMKYTNESKTRMIITSLGYEYMFKSKIHQVWEIILDFLIQSNDRVECLKIIFMLTYCEIGYGYKLSLLSVTQQHFIEYLHHFGLIYIKNDLFYPTHFAINIIVQQKNDESNESMNVSSSNNDIQQQQELKIIVQTNLQVTAYLSSDLHLALLTMFIDVTVRMPNMCMGRITREKCKESFSMGISADQMINFMISHAHPQVKKKTNIIPKNVFDQIYLWEAENSRIQEQDAIVVDCSIITAGMNKQKYDLLVRNLQAANALLWRDDERMLIAIPPESISSVNSFIYSNENY